MLKDENGRRLNFDNHKYDALLGKGKAEKQRKIHSLVEERSQEPGSKVKYIDLETIKRWNKFRRNDTPYSQPGEIEYVYIIAEVLGVDYRDLVSLYNSNNEDVLENVVAGSYNPAEPDGVETMETQPEENQILKPTEKKYSVDAALEKIKSIPVVRYYFESIMWYFMGINIGLIEKYRLFRGKADNYYDIADSVEELGNHLLSPYAGDVFQQGNWYQALIDKKYIRNRIKFLGIEWLYLVTCLKYICRIDIKWYQVIGVFFGMRNLSEEIKTSVMNLLDLFEARRLQNLFPVNDIGHAELFRQLSNQEASDYIAKVKPIILPESYEAGKNVKDRFDVIERYAGNRRIRMQCFESRETAHKYSVYDIRNQFLLLKQEEAVILYDDKYMGDVLLKAHIEAYAYEKGIPVIYCKNN